MARDVQQDSSHVSQLFQKKTCVDVLLPGCSGEVRWSATLAMVSMCSETAPLAQCPHAA